MNNEVIAYFVGSGILAASLGASMLGSLVVAFAFGIWAHRRNRNG